MAVLALRFISRLNELQLVTADAFSPEIYLQADRITAFLFLSPERLNYI
jgi:hypothetical protein